MALTYSSMLELGTKIPHFELKNVLDDSIYTSSILTNEKPSLIMIICNHCPYVIHYHEELKRMNHYLGDQIDFLAISSNDIENYPQDGPDKMKEMFSDLGLTFPYLYDETQNAAKSFKAECTPEFYLFDKSKRLVYRGRLDSSSPGNGEEITGEDFRTALDLCIDGKEINSTQYPSMGCNIKWK